MKNFMFGFFAIVLFASLLTSCKEDETPKSNVTIVHASPDAPGVDILVDDEKVNSAAVTFTQNTGYLSVDAGLRNVKLNVAGTTTNVINVTPDFAEGKNYSVFAVDSVSKLSVLSFTDDLTTPATGKAHVRFIHLSPNAPAVDIALKGGAVVFPNVAFKQGVNFTPLDAAEYELEVRVAGTQTVALSLPKIKVDSGKIYTIYASGFLGGIGAQALGAQIIVNK